MKAAVSLSLLALAGYAHAHAQVYGVFVNGADQGDGRNRYIRSPPNNYPVKDVRQPAIACNVNGGNAVGSFVRVSAGDRVTFEWYHNSRGDDIIDPSHHGPISTWIAPYTSGDASGAIWTKIAEEGVDGSERWAVDKLISNRGKWDVTLPGCLAPGRYLLRQEIIALHEADAVYTQNPNRGAQFYPSCVQIEVSSGGSTNPPGNFDLNNYSPTDPGIHFSLYQCPGDYGMNTYGCFGPYTVPGPAPWTCSGGNNPPPTTTGGNSGPTNTGGSGGTAGQYAQCGGNGYQGPTQCASPYTCQCQNEWYCQCL